MINVLVVIPYPEIASNFERVISRLNVREVRFSTTFSYGTSDSSIESFGSYDIVVVRGMTYYAVRRKFPELHAIEIMMSNTDVLNALYEVKMKHPVAKVGIILPDLTISGHDVLKELTGFDVEALQVDDEEMIDGAIDELIGKGCKIIIGGLTVSRICQKRGIDYEHIQTSDVTIERAIKDTLNMARSLDRERTRFMLTRTIFDSMPGVMIATNRFKTIIDANDAAEIFFNEKKLEGHKLDDFYPGNAADMTIKGHESLEIVHKIMGTEMLVSQAPFSGSDGEDGVLITMQKVEQFFKTEKKVRGKIGEKGLSARYHFSDIVADNIAMRQLIAKAIRYAQADGNVLLTGETGTGKELFVQSMHNASQRASRPFVAINCAAISEQLLESELFGYADGAFTGARKGGKSGLFEIADGGTIFLDEIGEMPINLQAKLLRVLQEKEIRKVGGDEVVPVDVRIMSATNQNIPELVEKGLFRRDLYYRINLLALHIPPLRDRGRDVDLLFSHFIRLNADSMSIQVPEIRADAFAALHKYKWDGNIRELRNVAERIMVLNGSLPVTAEIINSIDIPKNEVIESEEEKKPLGKKDYKYMNPKDLYERYLSSGLSLADFSKRIGLSRTTIWRRFKDAGFQK